MIKQVFLPAVFITAIIGMGFTKKNIHGDGIYIVNTEKSTIGWKGQKLTGSHFGTIKLKRGSVKMSNHLLESGTFEIDMATINDTDMTGEWKGKLEGHLKSVDFFATDKFPLAKFDVTGGGPLQADTNGNNYFIKGNLTIKGITNEIEFNATLKINESSFTAVANITIDRTKWGIKYNSKSFFEDIGDKLIYDDIELNINIVGDLQ